VASSEANKPVLWSHSLEQLAPFYLQPNLVKRINTNLRRKAEREETTKQYYTRGNQSENAHEHIRRTAAVYSTPVNNSAETVDESTEDTE